MAQRADEISVFQDWVGNFAKGNVYFLARSPTGLGKQAVSLLAGRTVFRVLIREAVLCLCLDAFSRTLQKITAVTQSAHIDIVIVLTLGCFLVLRHLRTDVVLQVVVWYALHASDFIEILLTVLDALRKHLASLVLIDVVALVTHFAVIAISGVLQASRNY